MASVKEHRIHEAKAVQQLVPLDEMEAMKPMDFDEDGSLVKSDAPIDNYLNDYFLDSLDRYFPKYIDPHDMRASILNVD